MKPETFTALRAIGVVYAQRLWRVSFAVALVSSALLAALALWLITMSAWWWLLGVPVLLLISVGIGLMFVVRLVIRGITPEQTSQQRQAVRTFVDRLQSTKDLVETPKFILLFRIVRSAAAPRSESFLDDAVNTKKLASDFKEIERAFEDGPEVIEGE